MGSFQTEYDVTQADSKILFNSPKLKEAIVLDSSKISSKLSGIFSKISNAGIGQLNIPEGEELLKYLNCSVLHAMPAGSKEDIVVVIHDPQTGQNPKMSYSIKSQVGSPSTLLNASGATNFIFEINAKDFDMAKCNAVGTARKRIEEALSHSTLKFVGVANKTFENNLELIDSVFPEIMAFLLFRHFSTDTSSLKDIFDGIGDELPIRLSGDKNMSKEKALYKVKHFLAAAALGLTPSHAWDGKLSANGGYLIIKSNGDLVCYHIFNMDDFKDYLFNSTKFERGSESRHQYGKVYMENGKYFIKLNLQIRFTR